MKVLWDEVSDQEYAQLSRVTEMFECMGLLPERLQLKWISSTKTEI